MGNIQLVASDGFTLGGYRADPKGKPRGGIVLVQEIFGVNNHIRKIVDEYAADGYAVIAPAYFDRVQQGFDVGYSQADMEAGRGIVQKLDWANVVLDTQAAVNELRSAGKSAVVGYCWGGTVAWLAAAKLKGLACTAAYYGGGVPGMRSEKPQCPVMFHWGEKDHAIPLDAIREVEAAHPSAVSHTYPTAGHGFNCDERASYEAASAKLARVRTLEFLAKHVG